MGGFTSPFSGISLIAHLLVIGVAKLISAFKFHVPSPIRQELRVVGRLERIGKIAVSFVVVTFIFSTMSASFVIALNTGAREGKNEPQVVFVKKQLSNVKNWLESDFIQGVAVLN